LLRDALIHSGDRFAGRGRRAPGPVHWLVESEDFALRVDEARDVAKPSLYRCRSHDVHALREDGSRDIVELGVEDGQL
jgi:hypothetical protein